MASPTRPVLIAGGGIGGLVTAIALARTGVRSHILERSGFAELSGAGIQLGPNATRILAELGVLDALMPEAVVPDSIHLFDGRTGRELTTVPLGEHAQARYRAPYLTFHRADLHAGLLAAAKTIDAITLTQGFQVTAIERAETQVAVTSLDGAEAIGAALIGADGLWSTVRAAVTPGPRLQFSGATAFRTMLPSDDVPAPFATQTVGLWLGPRAHLVCYPVRGGRALNVVAVVEGGHAAQGWNERADLSVLHAGFTGWCNDSKSLLDRAERWRSWSLYSLAALPHWTRGLVTLLGDAAHPVLPYLAQGAGLAIEDAAILARCFAAAPGHPAAAFNAYECTRRARAERLQTTSRRLGRLYHLGGLARTARNVALQWRDPARALSRFDWLYGAGS